MCTFYMQQPLAYELEGGFFYIQTCDDGYDYTCYDENYREIDGGQFDDSELMIDEAAKELMEEYFPHSSYELISAEDLMEKVEELEKI